MQKNADITFQNNQFFISGDLNFSNVMSVYEKSLPQLNQSPECHFNFSQLTSSDSSGIALIIEWVKLAKRHHKPIKFVQLSQDLMSLAKAARLDTLI